MSNDEHGKQTWTPGQFPDGPEDLALEQAVDPSDLMTEEEVAKEKAESAAYAKEAQGHWWLVGKTPR